MPSASIAIAILLISFIVLLIIRVPVTFALAVSSVLTAIYFEVPLLVIVQKKWPKVLNPHL